MKKELRKSIIQERLEMSSETVAVKSMLIANRLFGLKEFQHAKAIMSYVDFRNEVSTEAIITAALSLGKRVFVPVCEPEGLRLIPSEIKEFPDDLVPGTWGILEPRPDAFRPVDPMEIDLVLVPGVAFDRLGNRLGYGAGYYDRFLPRLREGTPLIALAFALQVRDEVYSEAHDCPVDMVITEEQVINCRLNRRKEGGQS